jgi:hypothetical protein
LEIDLTYACNLRCNDCNRSVTQAPSSAHLTKAQISRFIEESVSKNYHWHRVRLLGGEPTLHPEFLEIVELLRQYRQKYAKDVALEVITNGHGTKVRQIISQIASDIIVRNTNKTGNLQTDFEPFNRAPCDLPEHAASDYTNGCWITEYCGTGLTPSGYYHCAIAGGIDRVFGFKLGRASIPDPSDPMHIEMSAICRLCGHFCKQVGRNDPKQRVTATWRRAYAAWHTTARSRQSTHSPAESSRRLQGRSRMSHRGASDEVSPASGAGRPGVGGQDRATAVMPGPNAPVGPEGRPRTA